MPKFVGHMTRRVVHYERATVELDETNNLTARDRLHELSKRHASDPDNSALKFETFRGPDYDTAELSVTPIMGSTGLSEGMGAASQPVEVIPTTAAQSALVVTSASASSIVGGSLRAVGDAPTATTIAGFLALGAMLVGLSACAGTTPAQQAAITSSATVAGTAAVQAAMADPAVGPKVTAVVDGVQAACVVATVAGPVTVTVQPKLATAVADVKMACDTVNGIPVTPAATATPAKPAS